MAVADRLLATAVGASSAFYGGVIEELLLRWGLLALIAAGLAMAGLRDTAGFWLSNLLSALLFGAGHLPAANAIAGPLGAFGPLARGFAVLIALLVGREPVARGGVLHLLPEGDEEVSAADARRTFLAVELPGVLTLDTCVSPAHPCSSAQTSKHQRPPARATHTRGPLFGRGRQAWPVAFQPSSSPTGAPAPSRVRSPPG